jgi:hypothetical protein
LSFFSSPAKEGALNDTATATAMIAINMLFIVCDPLLVIEYGAMIGTCWYCSASLVPELKKIHLSSLIKAL